MNRSINRQSFRWSRAFFFLLLVGVGVIIGMAFRGVSIPNSLSKDSTPTWALFIQPVATVLAASGVLIAAFITKNWQDKLRNLQEEQFETKREDDLRNFEEKEKAEKLRFDRKALADEFTDILNRFSSTAPVMRANAAIRLAEMGKTPQLGKPTEFVHKNYPFFERAASHLAAALHMEEEQKVRDEIEKSVVQLMEFAEEAETEGSQQVLLEGMIPPLIDANLSAKRTFIHALAAFCPPPGERTESYILKLDDHLRPLLAFAPFCDQENARLVCLRDIAEGDACREDRASYEWMRNNRDSNTELELPDIGIPPNKTNGNIYAFLPPIELGELIRFYAFQLMDTRDALAACLRAMNHIKGREWPLSSCFLAGANLCGAQLQGADLQGTELHGARIYGAQLTGVKLAKAHWEHVNTARIDSEKGGSVKYRRTYTAGKLWKKRVMYQQEDPLMQLQQAAL